MELAHRISRTVESGRLVIDLPPDFSPEDEVEVGRLKKYFFNKAML
jgi:hypothetical protein